jgi:hypothetical protein
MPSSLRSYAEFDQLLASVRIEVEAALKAEPNHGAIASVKQQLDALYAWTRSGRCPRQAEKDQLNFGQIASRELDHYNFTSSLYELSSFVIYWETTELGN